MGARDDFTGQQKPAARGWFVDLLQKLGIVKARPEEQELSAPAVEAQDEPVQRPQWSVRSLRASLRERLGWAQSDSQPLASDPQQLLEQPEECVRPRLDPPVRTFTRLGQLLPYECWDPETELFFIAGQKEYTLESVGFALELSPQIGASPEMADYLSSLFQTGAPAGTGISVHLVGSPDLTAYFDAIRAASLSPETTDDPLLKAQRAFFKELEARRIAHYAKGAIGGLMKESNFRARDLRAVCTVVVPVPSSIAGAEPEVTEFMRAPGRADFLQNVLMVRETFISTLKAYHLYASTWGPDELINWTALLLNMPQTHAGEFPRLQYDPGRPLREQIVSAQTRTTESQVALQFDDGTNPPIMARALSVRSFPKQFALSMMSELLGSTTNPTLAYPCPFVLTLGVQTVEFDSEKNRTVMKAARATQVADSPLARFQPDVHERKADWDIALHAFNEGKGTIKMYLQLMLFAPPKDMPKAEQAARAIWRHCGFDLAVDRCMHKLSLLASLPMTFGPLLQADMKAAWRLTTKTVSNAANMMPCVAESCGLGRPILTLLGRRGQVQAYDLLANPSGNFNGIVVGTSGSGKSNFMAEMAMRTLAVGGKVFIIDVGHNYEKLCKMVPGGQYLEFDPHSKISLNPFSLVEDLNEDMELLKPMLGQMISPSAPLSDYEFSQIDINVRQLWAEFGRATTVTMLAERLKKACYQGGSREAFGVESEVPSEQCDPRIRDLGVQLFPFTSEGAYGRFFEGEANVDLRSNFVVLELEALTAVKDLQAVVLLMLMYQIMRVMYRGDRKQPILCIIDEAWALLHGGQAGRFIEEGYRRARRYRGMFMTGTQGVGDYFKSDSARATFENADWMFLLRQKPESIEELAKSGKLLVDDYTKSLLRSVTTRQGQYSEVFVRCGDQPASVGRLFMDPFSQLTFSSKAEDFAAVRDYVNKGFGMADAVHAVLRDRGITA
jgi:conjugal transfer ATP-binding protein TraC